MRRHPLPRYRRLASVAALTVIFLGPPNSLAQATVKPNTYPAQDSHDDPPKITTTTGKIADESCQSGKRWVIYTYMDGKLTETQYDNCV